ncbi:hypothetical protein QAD02_020302 [Eretmocerus hayati]|uniref:Uncharacterized protein n=1 Tax=Eretmocerus hayati TaxID=131215 RepID=A0ACC2PRU7_9HYME|nr:hypothetical protein QAD02_020302 [Eretmocerus hayati]
MGQERERIYREKNVIIFGVQESNDPLYLSQVINSMLARAPFNPQDIQYYRIGKEAVDKPRPVKLILQTASDGFCVTRRNCVAATLDVQVTRLRFNSGKYSL